MLWRNALPKGMAEIFQNHGLVITSDWAVALMKRFCKVLKAMLMLSMYTWGFCNRVPACGLHSHLDS